MNENDRRQLETYRAFNERVRAECARIDREASERFEEAIWAKPEPNPFIPSREGMFDPQRCEPTPLNPKP